MNKVNRNRLHSVQESISVGIETVKYLFTKNNSINKEIAMLKEEVDKLNTKYSSIASFIDKKQRTNT